MLYNLPYITAPLKFEQHVGHFTQRDCALVGNLGDFPVFTSIYSETNNMLHYKSFVSDCVTSKSASDQSLFITHVFIAPVDLSR